MGQDLEEKSQVEVTPGKTEQGSQSMGMFFPDKTPADSVMFTARNFFPSSKACRSASHRLVSTSFSFPPA